MDQSFLLEQWSNCERPIANASVRHKKSCQESGKETMVEDIEELEQIDASELHASKAQCKGSVNANER